VVVTIGRKEQITDLSQHPLIISLSHTHTHTPPHTATAGDLRKHLNCYFDTTIGNKRDTHAYTQIALSLGVDHPSEILFLTDVIEEAIAAREAGVCVCVSVRPGNKALDAKMSEGFDIVRSFEEVDQYI
jgi:methionine salvage enolase-phosphatase E1